MIDFSRINAKSWYGSLLIIALAATVGFASYILTKNSQNPIEEAAELVIDKELGLPAGAVKLTPEAK